MSRVVCFPLGTVSLSARCWVPAAVGPVGPDYIPAHAHADTLNFELALFGHRLIVDSGVSTYQKDAERQYQRSTKAHNTVSIGDIDSSEVWGGFRVGRRARPFDMVIKESDVGTEISCAHDGYVWLPGKPIHKRTWRLGDGTLKISDTVGNAATKAIARLHFHPDASIEPDISLQQGTIRIHGKTIGYRVNQGNARIIASRYYPEFGTTMDNACIEIDFNGENSDIELIWN